MRTTVRRKCRRNIPTNLSSSEYSDDYGSSEFSNDFGSSECSAEYSDETKSSVSCVSDELWSRKMLSDFRRKFVRMWFLGIRQNVVGDSDEIPTNL